MDSDELKYAIMQYWRFKRQAIYIATEVGGYGPNIKDVFCIAGKKIIEVECKISASDFMADFKKRKHVFYEQGIEFHNTPNHLYYAVPKDLSINEEVFQQYPKYGLLRVSRHPRFENDYVINFVRRAKSIDTRYGQASRLSKAQDVIFKRMASEIINVHRRIMKLKDSDHA